MTNHNVLKKVLAAFLAFAMVFGALVSLRGMRIGIVSAEGTKDGSTPNAFLDKTAYLEADGTYTIKLSAYVTGEVTTSETITEQPTDFILLIDQSGSMENVLSYANNTYYQYHLKAVQESCKAFINEVYSASSDDADHRIAIAGFAMGTEYGASYKYNNTGHFNASGNFVKYNGETSISSPFIGVRTLADRNKLESCVNKLSADGGTATHEGFNVVKAILEGSKTDGRNKVVVFFSDGVPGYYGYSGPIAADAINSANKIKKAKEAGGYGAKIFSISLVNYKLANDTHAYYGNGTSYPKYTVLNVNNYLEVTPSEATVENFMKAVSSNFPNATARYDSTANAHTDITWGDANQNGSRYFVNVRNAIDWPVGEDGRADNVANLVKVFIEIPYIIETETTTNTNTSSLGRNAVMRDYLSQFFYFADTTGMSDSDIVALQSSFNGTTTVKTYPCVGQNSDGTYRFNMNQGTAHETNNRPSVIVATQMACAQYGLFMSTRPYADWYYARYDWDNRFGHLYPASEWDTYRGKLPEDNSDPYENVHHWRDVYNLSNTDNARQWNKIILTSRISNELISGGMDPVEASNEAERRANALINQFMQSNGLTIDFNFFDNSFSITGYDYGANACYQDANGYHGRLIEVTLKGVHARPDSVGQNLPTNNFVRSGIYPTPNDKVIPNAVNHDPNEPGYKGKGPDGWPENVDYSDAEWNNGHTKGTVTNPDGTTTTYEVDRAELQFPLPRVNIREHVIVYDFGIQLKDDDALDFFGKGGNRPENLDVAAILCLDDCYKQQMPKIGDIDIPDIPIVGNVGTRDWGGDYAGEYNYHQSYPYDKTLTGAESNDYNTYKNLFKAEIVKNGENDYIATFDPFTISHEDYTFAALLQLKQSHSKHEFEWCRLTFLPATNVLYEERGVPFNHSDHKDFMTFNNGKGVYSENNIDAPAWQHTEGWNDENDFQSGQNKIYGYDSDYTKHNDTTDSHGGAHYVTVTHEMYDELYDNPESNFDWPSVEFTFRGTGMDLISRSGVDTGLLVVNIVPEGEDWTYKGKHAQDWYDRYLWKTPDGSIGTTDTIKEGKENGWTPIRTRDYAHIIVDTYYKDGKGKSLYQIPVLRYDGLEYGDYKVLISAVYMPLFDHQSVSVNVKGADLTAIPGVPAAEYELSAVSPNSKDCPTKAAKGEFTCYIDAVRIYHPCGENISGRGVDERAYLEANGANGSELNPTYYQFKALVNDFGYASGMDLSPYIYIDEYSTSGANGGQKPIRPQDYRENGPNNELYIKKTSDHSTGLALKVQDIHAGVHISMKSAFPELNDSGETVSGGIKVYINNKLLRDESNNPVIVRHATELYYDITKYLDVKTDEGYAYFTITCEPENAGDDPILSLVNLKLIPKQRIGETTNSVVGNVVADQSCIDFSEAVLMGVAGDANHDRQTDIIDALIAMRYSLENGEIDIYGRICADMNYDNRIDLIDALSIMRLSLNNN
ncbi:MAG: hypothetical protein IKI64_05270 [Clostridia bacterium]|nr:hypothetical protein [Clostridia bacterium]